MKGLFAFLSFNVFLSLLHSGSIAYPLQLQRFCLPLSYRSTDTWYFSLVMGRLPCMVIYVYFSFILLPLALPFPPTLDYKLLESKDSFKAASALSDAVLL